MRGAGLPERREAEFARLTEIDDAVDAFLDRDEFRDMAPDGRELVAVAVRTLLGVVRRFEGHELTLVLQRPAEATVTISYRNGSPCVELSPTTAGSTNGIPAAEVVPDLPDVRSVAVPGQRRPPAAPATAPLPRRDPGPADETGAGSPSSWSSPPPRPRELRADVAAELEALREAMRRRNGSYPDPG